MFTSQIIKEPYIVDHHIKRDRTEVIKRERALFHDSIETKAIKRPVNLWLAIKHKFTGYYIPILLSSWMKLRIHFSNL